MGNPVSQNKLKPKIVDILDELTQHKYKGYFHMRLMEDADKIVDEFVKFIETEIEIPIKEVKGYGNAQQRVKDEIIRKATIL